VLLRALLRIGFYVGELGDGFLVRLCFLVLIVDCLLGFVGLKLISVLHRLL
jgi:hypothetical protein